MSADELGLGEPEVFEPDSRAESIRQGGIGVVSVAVIIGAVVLVGAVAIGAVVWLLPVVLPLFSTGA